MQDQPQYGQPPQSAPQPYYPQQMPVENYSHPPQPRPGATPQEPQYVQIVPQGHTLVEREPFRFALPNGDKFTLPHLQSGDMPLELVETVLTLTTMGADDEIAEARATGAVLAYFRTEQPKLHRTIKKHRNQIAVATGLIHQWAEHSQIDPKASGSPTR